jgi:DNA polymerase III delta subunit
MIEGSEDIKAFYNSLDTLPYEKLKKAFENLPEIRSTNPESVRILKELGKEFRKLSFLIEIEERESYPPTLFKHLGRTAWQIIYFERAMRYTFFIGMFAILIFSIINLLR